MDRSEPALCLGEPRVVPADGATAPVLLRFTADHVGPAGIAAGLKNLADGTSRTETWVIARQAQPDRPQCLFAQCTVARLRIGDLMSWRFCRSPEGTPLNEHNPALLPVQGPQDIESACAHLAAHLCHLAQQHKADVFRLDHRLHGLIDAPVTAATPDRIWYRLMPCRYESTPVTTTCVRERLCQTQQLSTEAAERRLESVAAGGGLLRMGEEWYSSIHRRVLPPLSRDDYDRIERALQIHIESCDGDRARHGQAGHYGAARALASEAAAARHTLGLIQSLTQDLPVPTSAV